MREVLALTIFIVISFIAIRLAIAKKIGNVLTSILLGFSLLTLFLITNNDFIKRLKWKDFEIESFQRNVTSIKKSALDDIQKQISVQKQSITNLISVANDTQAKLEAQNKTLSGLIKSSEKTERNLNTQRKAYESLYNKASESKSQISDMLTYGEVSTWRTDGLKSLGGGLNVDAPMSDWLKGYVQHTGVLIKPNLNEYKPNCDSSATGYYKSMIAKNPHFPWPYYFLAICLKNQGDKAWLGTAKRGIYIFEHTTKIPGHDSSHDDGLARLNELLRK
jgi:hypothetical protein